MLYPQENSCRGLLKLDGYWRFSPDPKNVGRSDKWFTGIPGGRDIPVPCSFNEIFTPDDFDGLEIMAYEGTVWYEKKFSVPEDITGKRSWLRVGCAYYTAYLWVNGVYIGEYAKGFLPFDVEITDHIIAGQENLVVLALDNTLSETTLPQYRAPHEFYTPKPTSNFDWYPYTGLHRPVYVYWTASDCIRNVKVEIIKEGNDAHIDFKVTCADAWEKDVKWAISLNGKVLNTGSISGAQGQFILNDVDWWSPESPAIHTLTFQLADGSSVIDEYNLDIGIRTIEVKGTDILLNGEPVKLRGIGMHEDWSLFGKGIDPVNLTADFSRLRWLGANTIRCIHYPYSEEFYDMADREGFMCLCEVPAWVLDCNHLTPELQRFHRQMLKEMIERDQNRACIICWIVANEPQIQTDPMDLWSDPDKDFLNYFKEVIEYTRTLDNRPITITGATRRDETYLKYCDIAAINRYMGWYHYPGRPEKGLKVLKDDIEFHSKELNKPVIITEYGADGFPGEHSIYPEMHTEEYQAKLLYETTRLIDKHPLCSGGTIWAFCDFKTAQFHMRIRGNHKGVFNRYREPKLAARIIRSYWKNKPLFDSIDYENAETNPGPEKK